MDERNKSLLKNTSILMIGDFSSKLLSFILVPMYTHYLLPADFGEVDFYLILLSMLYIVVSLQSVEIAFRFVQDRKEKENITSTISNASAISLFGIILFSLIMIVYGSVTFFHYSYLFIAYVATSIFANLFLHTLRGIGKTTSYVIINIISTVISAICNVLFIAGLSMGAISLLITPIICNVTVIVIVFYKEKLIQYFSVSALSLKVLKEQLRFSIPLIPNAISIWLLSSIGRFVLLFYYGTHAVGIFAFALKFPMLLGTFSGVFQMAWQVSSISQYNAHDKNSFASNVFNQYAVLIYTSLLLFLPTIKIIIFTIMDETYIEAWIYIPVFLFGIVFRMFSQFYNTGFFGAKKTSPIFQSSLIASIIYFFVGIVLAKPLYILGIAIAYSISEFVCWVYVIRKVSPYLKISIKFIKQLPFLIYVTIFIILYYIASIKMQILILIIGVIIAIISNRQFINHLIKQKITNKLPQ
jgi:O-antigen/teichoic acid export membrane protein